MKNFTFISFLLVCLAAQSAHAAPQVPSSAVLVTPGFVIESKDGQHFMKPGHPIAPFAVEKRVCWTDVHAMAMFGNIYRERLTEQLDKGLRNGAVAVRVTNTKTGESVNGRLLFCGIHAWMEARGISEYKVQVPEAYFNSALAGDFVAIYAKTFGRPGANANGYVWILWLSIDEI